MTELLHDINWTTVGLAALLLFLVCIVGPTGFGDD